MRIICSAKMGFGTLAAKFGPLSKVDAISEIYIMRKTIGPPIPKVKYILLPSLCRWKVFNLIVTPALLAFYTKKLGAAVILSYHMLPHALFSFIAHGLTRKPFIVAQTGLDIQTQVNNTILKTILTKIFAQASYLFVPGEYSRNFWLGVGVAAEKLVILHSSVDTSIFIPHSGAKEFDFIYLGRLDPVKRIDWIVNSFHKIMTDHPKASLAIVGSGPAEKELKELVSQCHLENKIRFFGFQLDVKKWYAKARYFVLASRSEGLPTALMEAMSCGLVPICSQVGNIPDVVIEQQTGFLFHPDDPRELTQLMGSAMDLGNEYERLSGNARSLIEKQRSFSSTIVKWDEVLTRWKSKEGIG